MSRTSRWLVPQYDVNPVLDLTLDLMSGLNLDNLRVVEEEGQEGYIIDGVTLQVQTFADGTFDNAQVSFGYVTGKGVMVCLNNYIEHTVVINHYIGDSYHTLEFVVPPDSAPMAGYRDKFDIETKRIIEKIGGKIND